MELYISNIFNWSQYLTYKTKKNEESSDVTYTRLMPLKENISFENHNTGCYYNAQLSTYSKSS